MLNLYLKRSIVFAGACFIAASAAFAGTDLKAISALPQKPSSTYDHVISREARPTRHHRVHVGKRKVTLPSPERTFPGDFLPKNPSIWSELTAHFQFLNDASRPEVRREIRWYLNHRHAFVDALQRAKSFLPYIYREIEKRNMPAEFAFLPLIESQFDPFAYSPTGAEGLWQMMPSLAITSGLDMNWWYDRRRNVLLSTQAALGFLKKLQKQLDSWYLAAAAYNAGEGTVLHALTKAKAFSEDKSYWSLGLPKETARYVPKLIALATIVSNPKAYNVVLPKLSIKPYFAVVPIKGQVSVAEVSHLSRVSIATLKRLNPDLRRWVTKPFSSYDFLLPQSALKHFAKALARHQDQRRISWEYHQVRPHETLAMIAKNHHTQAKLLQRVNGLKAGSTLMAGSGILVPLYLRHTYAHLVDFNKAPFTQANASEIRFEQSLKAKKTMNLIDSISAKKLLQQIK